MQSQAERIITKFDGPAALAAAIRETGVTIADSTVYRWGYPRDRAGTGGFIPSKWIPNIHSAANRRGIKLTPGDWQP